MPGKAACNKIQDPVERKKCLNYQGKYAQGNPATSPTGPAAPKRPSPKPGSGSY